MIVRPVQPTEAAAWERMREQLWPSEPGEHAAEIAMFFEGKRRRNPAEVLLAITDQGQPVGFAELSIRSYAEGCRSGRVAYLEGWFVERALRGKRVGAALLKAAEDWARSRGCIEFASDTEIENISSALAHKRLGFEETGRIICFRKAL